MEFQSQKKLEKLMNGKFLTADRTFRCGCKSLKKEKRRFPNLAKNITPQFAPIQLGTCLL
jgi:hypothetical protein